MFRKIASQIIIFALLITPSFSAKAGDDPVELRPARPLLSEEFLRAVRNSFIRPHPSVRQQWNSLTSQELANALADIVGEGSVPAAFEGRLSLEAAQHLAWNTLYARYLANSQADSQLRYLLSLARLSVIWGYVPPSSYINLNGFSCASEWLLRNLARLLQSSDISIKHRKTAKGLLLRIAVAYKIRNAPEQRRRAFWESHQLKAKVKSIVEDGLIEEEFLLVLDRFLRKAYKKVPMTQRAGQILALARMFLKHPSWIGDDVVLGAMQDELHDLLEEVTNSPETDLAKPYRFHAFISLGEFNVRQANQETDADMREAYLGVAYNLFKYIIENLKGSKMPLVHMADILLEHKLRFIDNHYLSEEEALDWAEHLLRNSYSDTGPSEGKAREPEDDEIADDNVDQDTLLRVARLDLRKQKAKRWRDRLFNAINHQREELAQILNEELEQEASNDEQTHAEGAQTEPVVLAPATTSGAIQPDSVIDPMLELKETIDWGLLVALANSLQDLSISKEIVFEDYLIFEELAIENSGEMLRFSIHRASGHEHDCFFNAHQQVGFPLITRKNVTSAATGLLSEAAAGDEYIRRLVAPEILSLIQEGVTQLPDSVMEQIDDLHQAVLSSQAVVDALHLRLITPLSQAERAVMNTSLATLIAALSGRELSADDANLLRQLRDAMQQASDAREARKQALSKRSVYEAFIRDFIGGRTGHLYNMMGLVLGGTGTIDAIAEHFGYHLQIIQVIRGTPTVIHERKPRRAVAGMRTVRLLYNGVNHFDGLVEIEPDNMASTTSTSSVSAASTSVQEVDHMDVDVEIKRSKKRKRVSKDTAKSREELIEDELALAIQEFDESGEKISGRGIAKKLAKKYPDMGSQDAWKRAVVQNSSFKNLDSKYLKRKRQSFDALVQRKALIEKELAQAIEKCKSEGQKFNAYQFVKDLKLRYPDIGASPKALQHVVLRSDLYTSLEPKYKEPQNGREQESNDTSGKSKRKKRKTE